MLLNDRFTIARKLSGSREANADVFVVFDEEELHVQKVLKVLTNQELHVLNMFKVEQTILMELDHPGIPKGRDAFTVSSSGEKPSSGEKQVPCVVMEKIQGETLQDYIHHQGPIDQATAIDWMQQLTNILGYIHSQKLFHRDIKLTNIMRREDGSLSLIDFGTSRHTTQTIVNGGQNTVVFSYGYTAPEQLAGKAEVRSDFYALGRTFSHLLMGELPSEWKTFSPKKPISNSLLKLLQDLTEDDVKKRPKDAKTILRRLREISNEPRTQQIKTLGWVFMGGVICGSIIMTPLLRKIDWKQVHQQLFPAPLCDDLINRISCGEEMLVEKLSNGDPNSPYNSEQPESKKIGIKSFQEGNYNNAISQFQTAFNEQKDPETLIYLNNAKVMTDKVLSKNKVAIAAVIPIGFDRSRSRALSILRGVAQAQNDAIKKFSLGMQVIIVDDNNDRETAKAAASVFIARQDILAGVGHASSDALIPAQKIYHDNKMVFIAPASTSEELSSDALIEKHTFFRSLPSNRINALYMSQLIAQALKQKKVALYYNPDSAYSRSLASSFREASLVLGVELVNDEQGLFNISKKEFQHKKALQYARSQGATAHILIPDAAVTKSEGVKNAYELVMENCGKDWIVAGDSLAGMPEYLTEKAGKCTEKKMIFSAAWDVSQNPNSELIRFWKDPKNSDSMPVDWRTYTSYNATWILATALNDSTIRTRESLRGKLDTPGFKAIGMDGEIRFREKSGELADPKITMSVIQQCGDRLTTVDFYNQVCPKITPPPKSTPKSTPKPIPKTP